MQTMLSTMDPEQLRTMIDRDALTPIIIQQNRSHIRRITGVNPPKNPGEIPEWWSDNKSYVSRKLNEVLEPDTEELEEDENEEDKESDTNEV